MDASTVVIILSGATMLGLATVMSVILGWANEAFHVEVDPKIEAVQNALPQANCGACGFVGCADFAEAVVKGDAPVDGCPPGGPSCAAEVAEIMGVEVEEKWPYKAVLHCGARYPQRLHQMDYKGEKTCKAANVISGIQGCTYGCLGFADCMHACDYDAISMDDGLPVVDYDACVGCRACERECPRNLYSMVPFKAERMLVVACSNHDTAKEVKAVCTIGCTGCKQCEKQAGELFHMKDNVPEIDYEHYLPSAQETHDAIQKALDKCPMESLVYVGKPSAADIAATADEKLPERVEGNFETTVDKTEWWG
jgi:RnfABCDGE-type electron transport complex B subunit